MRTCGWAGGCGRVDGLAGVKKSNTEFTITEQTITQIHEGWPQIEEKNGTYGTDKTYGTLATEGT